MGVRCEAAVRWLHMWLLSDLVRVSVRTGVMMIELTWELLNIVTPRWSGFYFWILFDFWFASVRFHAVTLCWKVFNAMDSARCVYTLTHTPTHTHTHIILTESGLEVSHPREWFWFEFILCFDSKFLLFKVGSLIRCDLKFLWEQAGGASGFTKNQINRIWINKQNQI